MSRENKKNCIIAGGGAAGILAAILLADVYKNVTVVEKNDTLGGLLASCQDDEGNHYDMGTHVPSITNIKELDDILFGTTEKRKENWIKFDRLLTQSYFNGIWNRKSQLIDARSVGQEKYEKGIVEFFHSDEKCSVQDNLAKFLTETYGSTFAQEIFAPILEKLFGVAADRLEAQNTLNYFGLTRLIMLTDKVTHQLKQIDFFDKKMGFHTNTGSAFTHYYPKSPKGCGYWIDLLVEKAQKKGVVFKANTMISKINVKNKEITSIEASGMDGIDCDLLVWTIPPVLALKAAGIYVSSPPPVLRTASIFHYCLDQELLIKDALYVWCMDPKFKSFRITLYPNLNPRKQNSGYTVTSEILSSPEESKKFNSEMVFKELVSLGIVAKNSQVLSHAQQTLHNTFPVPEVGFIDNANRIAEKIQNEMQNLLLFGRSTGKTWFMTDVLKDVYEKIVPTSFLVAGKERYKSFPVNR